MAWTGIDMLAVRHFHEKFFPETTLGRDGSGFVLYDSERPSLYVSKEDGRWKLSLEGGKVFYTDTLDTLTARVLAPRWKPYNKGDTTGDIWTKIWELTDSYAEVRLIPEDQLDGYFVESLPQGDPENIVYAPYKGESGHKGWFNLVFFRSHLPRIIRVQERGFIEMQILTEDCSLWIDFLEKFPV